MHVVLLTVQEIQLDNFRCYDNLPFADLQEDKTSVEEKEGSCVHRTDLVAKLHILVAK